MSFWHCRRQWPVGQGFFHSAFLGARNRSGELEHSVHYVYDCGAISKYAGARNREVAIYRSELAVRKIDLLFLSHFHADHVNGLPKIFAQPGAPIVDTIVMPLIDDTERLIQFAASTAAGAVTRDAAYRKLIANPLDALAAYGPRQIIMVRSNQSGSGVPGLDSIPPDVPDTDRPDSDKWKIVGPGKVRRNKNTQYGDDKRSPTAVFEMDDTLAFRFRPMDWLLAPYVDVQVSRRRSHFLASLAKTLGISRAALVKRLRDPAFRQSLVQADWRKLQRAYVAIAGDPNPTSMCLLSTPLSSGAFEAALQHGPIWWGSPWQSAERIAWLGTGDAKLAEPTRLRAFLHHFRPHLHSVHTLTMPHHGSDKDHSRSVLQRINPKLCVVAADRFKNWFHPGQRVTRDVTAEGATLSIVTSSPNSGLGEWYRFRQLSASSV